MVEIARGDVAGTELDAVVNAANGTLLGGGGVDGALHRGAGPELVAACRALPEVSPGVRCPTGEARLTPGFALRARWVIHTVGPVYDRDPDPAGRLASAMRASLRLAAATGARSVAVPALSCGAYGYPVSEAAAILVGVARERRWGLDPIRFVLFDAATERSFAGALRVGPEPRDGGAAPSDPAAFRRAAPGDDAAIASVIRSVMPTFGACGPGFAITDPEVDHMATAYRAPRSAYLVVEDRGRVVGGGGVGPLAGGDPATCELRKMYFLPEVRGRGVGRALLRQLLVIARGYGFRRCYLETLTGMDAAQRLYERLGFARLPGPLGHTGHTGCDRFYALDLGGLDPGAAGW
jgi:putative acetyltransferase